MAILFLLSGQTKKQTVGGHYRGTYSAETFNAMYYMVVHNRSGGNSPPPDNSSTVFITGLPNAPVLFCWLASVVVCNAAGMWAGRPPGSRMIGAPAAGRVGSRHCTAGQYCYALFHMHSAWAALFHTLQTGKNEKSWLSIHINDIYSQSTVQTFHSNNRNKLQEFSSLSIPENQVLLQQPFMAFLSVSKTWRSKHYLKWLLHKFCLFSSLYSLTALSHIEHQWYLHCHCVTAFCLTCFFQGHIRPSAGHIMTYRHQCPISGHFGVWIINELN